MFLFLFALILGRKKSDLMRGPVMNVYSPSIFFFLSTSRKFRAGDFFGSAHHMRSLTIHTVHFICYLCKVILFYENNFTFENVTWR